MPASAPALELKGRMLALTRIRVNKADTAAIEAQLKALAEQMPEAVHGMPVLLESAEGVVTDLALLVHQLRAVGMQPIGVADGPLREAAVAMGLAVLADASPTRAARSAAPSPPAATQQAASRRRTQIVDRPVRSGQQVYAEGADIIVTGAVSAGAEIIADGCVHVYGPVRGRVIAGARGDVQARVFCRKFDAELVAVAGVYAIAEQMQGVRGFSTQAFLDDGKLRIELMN
jgi:septum site-determining protein MinC